MNCKPGDLAIVVKSDAGNVGKVVRCVESLGAQPWLSRDGLIRESESWLISPPLRNWHGWSSDTCPDDQLRPIRDNGGEDETLTWAGKPSDIKTPEAA